MSSKVRCAVCGQVKSKAMFGDGVKCPKTTCLECFKKSKAKDQEKPKKVDPVTEYLKTLKKNKKND